ncbi:MAG TPA: glycosyltransferase family 4 protein [Acidimicrobiales bacterium]|nr:glycosyltransferase family 4 protein [Acidimicrobiales bacterium]
MAVSASDAAPAAAPTGARSRSLRIALIAPVWLTVPPLGYGGTERVVSSLAEELTARGHDVTLFAVGGSLTTARLVTFLEAPPHPADPGAFADEIFHTLSAYLHADDFDVIHDHSGFGPAMGAMLGGRPPVVQTLHGPWTVLGRRFAALVHDKVNLVAISRAQAAANPEVRYAGIIHNGIDLDAYPYVHAKRDYLAYVGRASPEKGTHLAVEVARRAGLPLKMAVKRADDAERAYWDEVVAPRLRGDEEIYEQPPHAVKWDILAHARATLFPIDWPEPFGLVLVESMACGTPVIARPSGAVPEIVADGTTGFLRESVDAMVDAVGHSDTLDRRQCRALVEERFSAAVMASRYEALYTDLVDAGDGESRSVLETGGLVDAGRFTGEPAGPKHGV